MYYYANVKLTRGCWNQVFLFVWVFFCLFVFLWGFLFYLFQQQQQKKKVQMWSSLLHFVTWICNYAFSEKGEGREEGEEVDLHLYVFRFLCPWYPHVWEGERRGSPGQHSEDKRDLPDPALRQVWLWSKFGGSAMPVHHDGAGFLILAMQC